MVHAQKRRRLIALHALMSIAIGLWSATTLGIQTPHQVPAMHERQCVPTGAIPPGDARTVTVTWKHPFATGDHDTIGSVSEPGDSSQAVELAHIVVPHTPTRAAAVVFNRDVNAAQSGVLCLDARAE